MICCARVIKIPFLILLSSLYANKVQKRSRSLQKTAERERGGEQQLLRIKTSVITHVLLVHNDAGDDDDEKKYRRWVRGKNMEWRSEMNAGRAQLIDNQYHTLRAWAEKRESSSAKTPCVTPVRGADAFFHHYCIHPASALRRHSTTQHPAAEGRSV